MIHLFKSYLAALHDPVRNGDSEPMTVIAPERHGRLLLLGELRRQEGSGIYTVSLFEKLTNRTTCTLPVRSRYGRSAVMVQSRFGHGTVAVRSKFGHGTVAVRSWYSHGTVQVRSWYGRGSVAVRSRYSLGTLPI